MSRSLTALILILALLSWSVPAQAYTHQSTSSPANLQIKWPSTTITFALSTSLSQPPPNVKAGSDVLGAVRRSLAQWAQPSNLRFIETTSGAQSISPSGNGDGISLITIANTTDNAAVFPPCGDTQHIRTARTRVFYHPDTGSITEADIALNPCLQFSTDGTSGTYDLEATLTHEIGHALGLDHSGVIGATMQPRQGQNNLFDLPALTPRTLAEDDRAAIRHLYGPRHGLGAIAGTLRADGAVYGAQVWAENTATGQAIAANVTGADGTFRIDGLSPGTYRVIAEPLALPVRDQEFASGAGLSSLLSGSVPSFRTVELASGLQVTADVTTTLNAVVADNGASTITPRLFGINGQLSNISVPLAPGKTYKLLIAGEGLDKIRAQDVTITSPSFTIDPSTFKQQDFGIGVPAITFDVSIAPDAKAGDYSVFFTTTGNEIAYLSGALTIEPPTG